MPYKNKDEQRRYQREWCRRKRLGLETKTKEALSEEEREKRYRERTRKNARNSQQKKRLAIRDRFGHKCFVCNSKNYLQSHKKDGIPHKKLLTMNWTELNIELQTNDYVTLCYGCHKHIHWMMSQLQLTWDDIESMILNAHA